MKKTKIKTKTLRNNFYMLGQVAKLSPMYLFSAVLEAVGGGLMNAASSVYTLLLFNALSAGEPLNDTVKIVFLMIGVSLINDAHHCFIWFYYHPIQQQVLHYKMQTKLFEKVKKLDLCCYDDPKFYNDFLIAMDESDARAINVMGSFAGILESLISVVAVIGVLATINIWMAIILFIINVLNSIFSIVSNKIDMKHYDQNKPEVRKRQYVLRVHYLIDAAKELRISKVSTLLNNAYCESIDKSAKLQAKYGVRLWLLELVSAAVRELTQCGVILYMTYALLITKTILLGGFAAALNAIWTLSWHLQNIMTTFTELHKHSLYIEKYKKFLAYEPKITGGEKSIPRFQKLTLKNATFAYNDENVLKNVNLEIKKGEKIAIVGYNGAGKSTLIKLLMRLYDVNGGQILWNGENIKSFEPDFYREHIGAVFQDYKIFSATIAENVMGGEFDKKDEKTVLEALERATFTEKLKTIDKGIYANLTREFDDAGITLSGGEAQKIAIARVFAHPYDLIIMDEPSSALDPIAEFELNRSISEYAKDKTVIFISHRLSTTRNADRIYMFAEGEVIESGSHNELIAQNGKYAEMFNMQAEKYNRKTEATAAL